MIRFDVKRPDQGIRPALEFKINDLTKPKGSLGRLEELALQVGLIQQTLSPRLQRPQNVLFAADHGIEREGVSLSPREITWQQVLHFLRGGGAGISFLCRQHGFRLRVVDAGVDYDFPARLDHNLPADVDFIDMKVCRGTRNFLYEPAMTPEEVDLCLARGAEVVSLCHKEGSNVLSFGEMGIANTSASSMWMTCLTGIPLPQCVGAGSGLDRAGIRHKLEVLTKALERYRREREAATVSSPVVSPGVVSPSAASSPTAPDAAPDVMEVIRQFGGLEMTMAVGGMLRAAELGMVILVDGFIMTACMLVASRICPAVMDYAIFGHCGDEAGHRLLLDYLGARPLISLGLRLGEGSGAVCAYPIVESAVRMINEMDTFSGAAVTKYF